MKLTLVDEARDWWRMASVQIQLVWGVMCTVFLAMPEIQQIALIGLVGLDGEKVLAAFTFFAQVNAGVAAATIAARVTKQSSVGG